MFSGEERDGTIECIFYDHSLMSPRDPSTSLSSGTIKHAPVMMRKQVDSTSPLFANALTTNETLESVVFRFVPATHSAGMPPAIYFVRLSNASIASFRQLFSETPAARYVGWQLLEEVGFHYQKIEWGFNDQAIASATWPIGP